MADTQKPITYADAGVDIDAGNALVERIKPAAKRTARPGTMAGLGGGSTTRSLWRRPMAWAPSCAWPLRRAMSRAWAAIWWPCA